MVTPAKLIANHFKFPSESALDWIPLHSLSSSSAFTGFVSVEKFLSCHKSNEFSDSVSDSLKCNLPLPQLVLHVDLTGSNEDHDPRSFRMFYRLPGGVYVLPVAPAASGDDGDVAIISHWFVTCHMFGNTSN